MLTGWILVLAVYIGDGKWDREILADGLTKQECEYEQRVQEAIHSKFWGEVEVNCKKANAQNSKPIKRVSL